MKTKQTAQIPISEVKRRTFLSHTTLAAAGAVARIRRKFLYRTAPIAVTWIVSPMALMLAMFLTTTSIAADRNPGVLPPDAKPLGVTYADWDARWWNWIVSFPEDESPLLIDNCNGNQGGKVFFLPHTFFGNIMETSCTVPTGTMVFATAGGVECSQAEGNGETEAELRQCVLDSLPFFKNPRIIINGRELQNIENHLFISNVFDLILPEDNVFGLPAGSTKSVAAGWHVILAPLTPGEHTIVVHDELISGEVAEVIVHLTVLSWR